VLPFWSLQAGQFFLARATAFILKSRLARCAPKPRFLRVLPEVTQAQGAPSFPRDPLAPGAP
jgi:hypothetical protein